MQTLNSSKTVKVLETHSIKGYHIKGLIVNFLTNSTMTETVNNIPALNNGKYQGLDDGREIPDHKYYGRFQ